MHKGNVTLIKQGVFLLLLLWGAYTLYLNNLANACVNQFYEEYEMFHKTINADDNFISNNIQNLCLIRSKVYSKFYDISPFLTELDLSLVVSPTVSRYNAIWDFYYSALIESSENKYRSSLHYTILILVFSPLLIIFGYNRFKELREQKTLLIAISASVIGTLMIPISLLTMGYLGLTGLEKFTSFIGLPPGLVATAWWLLTCYLPYFFAVRLIEYAEPRNEN